MILIKIQYDYRFRTVERDEGQHRGREEGVAKMGAGEAAAAEGLVG